MGANTNVNDKKLSVAKIDNGIVIDHITPPGRAFYVLKALNIDESYPHSVFVALNVPSQKLGRKDVLKIRNVTDIDLTKLGLIVSGANVIYIKDYHIIRKEKIQTPVRVTGLISCPGLSCITNQREDVVPEYIVKNKDESIQLRCAYCDKLFNVHEHISLMR
ncbi:MAG: aspartate carbamoyltransferase regulatory subunit [Candidatus Thorarchaeota archaeon]